MLINVKVRPNSKEESVRKISEEEYEVSVKEPAEDNKANVRLINLLSKEFGVSFKQIKIKTPRSRDKVVEINI